MGGGGCVGGGGGGKVDDGDSDKEREGQKNQGGKEEARHGEGTRGRSGVCITCRKKCSPVSTPHNVRLHESGGTHDEVGSRLEEVEACITR